jgi:hypothetical protein
VPAKLNEAFYPILLTQTDEPISDEELEAFFSRLARLADEAIKKSERYVVIVLNDPLKFTPAARKKLSAVQARYITKERNDVTLAAFIPVDNAIVRGAVTALGWVAPDLTKAIRFVRDHETALHEALAMLEARGTPYAGDLKALTSAVGLSR